MNSFKRSLFVFILLVIESEIRIILKPYQISLTEVNYFTAAWYQLTCWYWSMYQGLEALKI